MRVSRRCDAGPAAASACATAVLIASCDLDEVIDDLNRVRFTGFQA
jgi:hypothetical protein